ncbi:MAG: hypothetical protein OXG23_02315 [Chloroflexi bacterium]|nr:hypothetical protein [Chloroflexota bacterium]
MILGKCRYCRKQIYYVVDRLEGAHGKCKRRNKSGIKKIVDKMRNFAEFGGDMQNLKSEIEAIAESSYIKDKDIGKHVFRGWESAARDLLHMDLRRDLADLPSDLWRWASPGPMWVASLPSELEERNLNAVLGQFDLPEKKVRKCKAYSNLQRVPFLRNISAGRFPTGITNSSGVNLNLAPSEKLIWIFTHVGYYEQLDSKQLESHDKIMRRGLGTDSHRLKYNETFKETDAGDMGLSTEHLYFVGHIHRFRIPFSKVALFDRDKSGITFVQDGPRSRPLQFRLRETWFAYNLLVILMRRKQNLSEHI